MQTTPPMTIAATMPEVPLRPMLTNMADAIISVIRVMPDTGFDPTIAIALAATVVNRNAMSVTTIHATRACQNVWMTPIQKNTSTTARAMAMKHAIVFIDRSVCQRVSLMSDDLPLNSLTARPWLYRRCRSFGHSR